MSDKKNTEHVTDSNEDIFEKLDSFREILSKSNVMIKEHEREHGTLLLTSSLVFLEDNNFLNIVGIDYPLSKDNFLQFHQDIHNNILNIKQAFPNPSIIFDLVNDDLQHLRFSNILYRRGDELLCLELNIDSILNKYILLSIEDKTDSLIEKFILEDLVLDNEVLIKEIHHRVKNNIQILLSLMSLQERFDKTDFTIIKQMKLSLASLALLHSNLIKDNLSNVSINSIVEDFETKCKDLYSQDKIDFEFECNGDIVLEIDKANPILLVINELISQSVENHFENVKEKKIFCQLNKSNETIELIYGDTGMKRSSANDMLLLALISQTDGQSEEFGAENYQIHITIPLND